MTIITVSRLTKSGGANLAQKLAEQLGFSSISREDILSESSKIFNIDVETLMNDMRKSPSLWQRFNNERNRYISFIQCCLLRAAMNDNLVYHGYAGQIFFKNIPNVFRIKVVASMEQRIAAITKEMGYSREQSAKYIKKIDKERLRWVKFLYNEEWNDPKLYDLLIDMEKNSLEEAIQTILKKLDDMKKEDNSVFRRKLGNLALASEVRAAFASDDRLWNQPLNVEVLKETVYVRGQVRTMKYESIIKELLPLVKGVTDFEVYVNSMSDPMPGLSRTIDR